MTRPTRALAIRWDGHPARHAFSPTKRWDSRTKRWDAHPARHASRTTRPLPRRWDGHPARHAFVALAFTFVVAACATPTVAVVEPPTGGETASAVSASPVEPVVALPAEPRAIKDALVVEGKTVDGAGLVDVRALELACLADSKALTDTKGVRARFDDVAGKQLVPVGQLAFVMLERDPARSMTDPPPLLCRTIASSTVLHAPLVRAREPATRWLVKKIEEGLVADAAALVQQSATQRLELSAISERAQFLSRLFKFEFVFPVGKTFDQIFEETVEHLAKLGLVEKHGDRLAVAPDPFARPQLQFLGDLIRDYLESYLMAAMTLSELGTGLDKKEFLRNSVLNLQSRWSKETHLLNIR